MPTLGSLAWSNLFETVLVGMLSSDCVLPAISRVKVPLCLDRCPLLLPLLPGAFIILHGMLLDCSGARRSLFCPSYYFSGLLRYMSGLDLGAAGGSRPLDLLLVESRGSWEDEELSREYSCCPLFDPN